MDVRASLYEPPQRVVLEVHAVLPDRLQVTERTSAWVERERVFQREREDRLRRRRRLGVASIRERKEVLVSGSESDRTAKEIFGIERRK